MRNFAYIALFVVTVSFTGDDRPPLFTMKSDASAFITDNLGNVYTISEDKFSKYDWKFNLMKEFSNKNFGNITSADVTNPLRPLLYYREFGRAIFLDNTLSQNGDPVALEKLGFPLATLAGSSFDNGLWIYDQPTFELLRFNNNLEIASRTGNLSQILGIDLQPNFIIEKGTRLFLNNPATGILVFDVFGTYMKTIPILQLTTFQVEQNMIIYFADGSLHGWNLETSETIDYTPVVNSFAMNMRMERDVIFVHDSTSISVFSRK